MGPRWLLSNILGGVVRWVTFTIITAICLVWGFAPAYWLAGLFGNPPAWVTNPWTRVAIVLAGMVACLLIILVRRRIDTKKNQSDETVPLQWKNVAITESNIAAYMRSSKLVHRLDDRIAEHSGRAVDHDQSTAISVVENCKLFGIPDVDQLDGLLTENQEAAVRMSYYSWVKKDALIPRGHCVVYLFDVLGAQLGEQNFSELRDLQSLSNGGNVKSRCENYAEVMKNISPKPVVKVPLVADFNLTPIEVAIAEIRSSLKSTARGKQIEASGRATEQQSLDYWNLVASRVRLYGTERGQRSRGPIGFMLHIVNAVVVENGKFVWRIPNGPIFDNLFVLIPDLRVAIEKIK